MFPGVEMCTPWRICSECIFDGRHITEQILPDRKFSNKWQNESQSVFKIKHLMSSSWIIEVHFNNLTLHHTWWRQARGQQVRRHLTAQRWELHGGTEDVISSSTTPPLLLLRCCWWALKPRARHNQGAHTLSQSHIWCNKGLTEGHLLVHFA